MTDLPYSAIAFSGIACSLVFAASWWEQFRTSNANLVDVIWSGAIGILALAFAVFGSGDPVIRTVSALLPALWSIRLALHIYQRALYGEEDARYRYLRAHWASHTQLKFFFFYQLQALTVIVFSFQFFVLANIEEPASGTQIGLAVLIWLIAMTGEALADRQLSEWRRIPANRDKACRSGLWRYSRHPNYFFEWLHWWSYVPLALGTSWWWLPLLTQGLMLLTLLKLTGIPYTERQALARRGDDYRDYQATTSAFVPWFPKARSK
ncbi:MAG: DUF1295 domain-containing protein [Methylotetracoccus sp.]